MGSEYRYSARPPSILRRSAVPGSGSNGKSARPSGLDWPAWLALLERKRRLVAQNHAVNSLTTSPHYFFLATYSSFRLDGIDVTEEQVIDACAQTAAQRKLRSRADQRVRNHTAILHHIERTLRIGQSLKSAAVVRWYTSISSGLCNSALGSETMSRLEQIARRINAPQLRLQAALREIVATHAALLVDPLFPSFNGILSRLLLRYQLGRCGLPFVVFNPGARVAHSTPQTSLSLQLLTAIDESYDLLLM
jgi:hypothetical protein